MSQSHIPQPNTTVPSEQILSTDEAPHGIGVSPIETPGPSPGEAIQHVGEGNFLDPMLYQQNIFCATFPWTTKDQPGKLLWYVPISPFSYNGIVAHWAKVYNTWVGSALFTFKIAGTGFHAGQITLVRLPPNIHPESLSGTKQYSVFPWVGFDPKMLEIASIPGRDQRPLTYHYTYPVKGQPDIYAIGGYIAAYVELSLNTSSSGSQAIQVNVWTKLDADFRFLQLRFPVEDVQPESVSIDPVLAYMLDFSNQQGPNLVLSSAPVPVSRLIVTPAADKILNHGVYNTFSLAGIGNSKWTPHVFHTPDEQWKGNLQTKTGGEFFVNGLNPYWQYESTKMFSCTNVPQVDGTGCTFSKWREDEGGFEVTVNQTSPDSWTQGQQIVFSHLTSDYEKSELVDNAFSAKSPNESFLVFAGKTGTLSSMQHSALSIAIHNGDYSNWLPLGQCALFIMNDVSEQLPLGFVKFYQEGFFTVAGSVDQIEYDIKNIKLIFYGFIQRTDPLPTNPNYSQNRLMVNLKNHFSTFKSSRSANAQKPKWQQLAQQSASALQPAI